MQKEVHFKRILISLVIAVIAYLIPFNITIKAHAMLFVAVFVAALWISEAVPLHATSFLAAFLLIIIVKLNPVDVFAQFFDPVIVLLLGGFIIAVAMSKYDLDKYIAYKILGKSGNIPNKVILAIIFTTAFLSMWINNSSAAAIIMPIALVILKKNNSKHGKSNFGKSLVLAVAYGATIGGIGTIVGSTPNVMAAKFLQDKGITFGFYHWFIRGFPFMLALIFITWVVLILLFKSEKKKILIIKKKLTLNKEQKKVIFIFGLTILLWLTESIHGISSSVIALVPIILLYFTGLLKTHDFLKVDWPTLILVGGGLALGYGIHNSSLDTSFASILENVTKGQNLFQLFLMLGIVGVLITVFVSNTTAAAVYLPIVVALASSFNSSITNVVVAAAIGVSLDFVFPFGTPPTAIAFSTRYVSMKDIAKTGIIISIFGILLLAGFALVW